MPGEEAMQCKSLTPNFVSSPFVILGVFVFYHFFLRWCSWPSSPLTFDIKLDSPGLLPASPHSLALQSGICTYIACLFPPVLAAHWRSGPQEFGLLFCLASLGAPVWVRTFACHLGSRNSPHARWQLAESRIRGICNWRQPSAFSSSCSSLHPFQLIAD